MPCVYTHPLADKFCMASRFSVIDQSELYRQQLVCHLPPYMVENPCRFVSFVQCH